jgi:hypothetical protein
MRIFVVFVNNNMNIISTNIVMINILQYIVSKYIFLSSSLLLLLLLDLVINNLKRFSKHISWQFSTKVLLEKTKATNVQIKVVWHVECIFYTKILSIQNDHLPISPEPSEASDDTIAPEWKLLQNVMTQVNLRELKTSRGKLRKSDVVIQRLKSHVSLTN